MIYAHMFDRYLMLALGVVAVVLAVMALADAVRRPAANFQRENKRTKQFWMGMSAAATLVCLLSLFSGGGGGMFQLIGACIACVYLADVKPAVSGKGGYYPY
ncbi:MAG: DUF2516 family protein [Paeniglutamicibacter terrestris]|jgi:hypothetical protein|uniref:DUF2516 family protein n=1 Tax=Paeniglutamicibacter terrestris TaxID=2723403 RepID=A0ABX1G8M5_9MICC|nr:DUF2516 family protein [Paeniglutamicibacter terrestris]ASN40528.1 hypothetical protein CGQ24_16965 [Arthrobacter sp. 7749]NKG22611.1 DUF2516 family protein [Paeniglutamicibacter terrestris]